MTGWWLGMIHGWFVDVWLWMVQYFLVCWNEIHDVKLRNPWWMWDEWELSVWCWRGEPQHSVSLKKLWGFPSPICLGEDVFMKWCPKSWRYPKSSESDYERMCWIPWWRLGKSVFLRIPNVWIIMVSLTTIAMDVLMILMQCCVFFSESGQQSNRKIVTYQQTWSQCFQNLSW